jgi:putative membrane protein
MFIRATAAIVLLVFASAVSSAQTTSKPTDPQIAHIAYTAGVIDIESAKLAVSKSKNKEVVAFAQGMLRDHEAVNVLALDLVKRLNVTPQDNDISKSLVSAAGEQRKKLMALSGAAFDRAYMQNEVDYHKEVNSALKTLLIPSASNAELKALLETGLKLFEGHQLHAEQVAAALK